jgi:Ribonuclease G/E
MVSRCDQCNTEFELQVRTRREGLIETTFFTCPECGREYTVYRTNPELRKMQQKIEQERARIAKQRIGGRLRKERLDAFEQMVAEHKAKLDEFNGRAQRASSPETLGS